MDCYSMECNYDVMECLSQGIIIKKIFTSEIEYINTAMKKMLNISPDRAIKSMNDIIQNESIYENITTEIIKDLHEKNLANGILYFNYSNEVIKQSNFKCKFVNNDKNLIMYAFDNSTELSADSKLNLLEVTELLPNGIMVMDIEPELSITYANEEQYKILDLNNSKDEFNKLLKYSIYEEDRDWVLSEIYENLHKRQNVDIEFRMKGKRNSIKWVRLYGRAKESANGETLFYSSIKDISDRREINDKLHIERILFHKITEISDEIIFRLDLKTNIIQFISNSSSKFGNNTFMENFPQSFLQLDLIYEDDIPIFLDLVEDIKKGAHKYVEFRYKTDSGELEWYKPIYTFVKDSNELPILVIGKLVNINNQKILQEQAKKDLLTGFLNKVSTEVEINDLITTSNSNEHALFIIDLDNFKAINDNFGHHFGDFVLKEISSELRNCFRKDDILGRIGGDEFIIVMKNCGDLNIAMEKAGQVCNRLLKTYTSSEGESYSISGSIGIATYPKDGETFELLYKRADKALYNSKETGRNKFTIYDKDFTNQSYKNMGEGVVPEIEYIDHINNSKYEVVDFRVIEEVLSCFYEQITIEKTIIKILKFLCEYYKIDRSYIFIANYANTKYINTYQWEIEDIEVESNTREIDVKVFNTIFDKSNTHGIFHTNNLDILNDAETLDIINKDNINSICLIKSFNINHNQMFIGLDDCTKKRIWTNKDIKTLYHVSKIIFLMLSK
ncbi:MAG: diguanylate cyclase [bacterium]